MSENIDTTLMVECVQCGGLPAGLEAEYRPELLVIAENFGEPYLFGIRCRICWRVAKGVGRVGAVKRWQDGGHDGFLDDFGNENAEG